MDSASQIERVLVAVNEFLDALDNRSWARFDACFARSATVFLTGTHEEPGGVFSWREFRPGWQQVFSSEQARPGPLDPGRGRPFIQVQGDTAFVSFTGRGTPSD